MTLILIVLSNLSCALHVRIGAEVLVDEEHELLYGNRRVALICNQTSVFADGTHLADSLLSIGVQLKALFAPEHGIRGASGAGESVGNGVDERTKLPVYSLYGKTDRPTDEMLKRIDVVVFDIQDVGARFYTYATTMALAMEAAGRNGKPFIVLDRPNPLNGIEIEGPLLDTAYASFVGRFPIPIRHGLTMGELAEMIVGEKWLGERFHVELKVIPMEGWTRSMWYGETGLPWIPPSPNMKTESTAVVYPGTCIFEATNVSEGRGSARPFEYIGAPWIDGAKLSARLESLKLGGVTFTPLSFTPKPDPAAAPSPKYANRLCGGVFVSVRDRNLFRPVRTGFMMLETIKQLWPDSLQVRNEMMDRLTGGPAVRSALAKGTPMLDVLKGSEEALVRYRQLREKYLLYE
jgi:uncharacterized protein YbbC (DUF1343 family)